MAAITGAQRPSPSDALSCGQVKCAHNHNPQPGGQRDAAPKETVHGDATVKSQPPYPE